MEDTLNTSFNESKNDDDRLEYVVERVGQTLLSLGEEVGNVYSEYGCCDDYETDSVYHLYDSVTDDSADKASSY